MVLGMVGKLAVLASPSASFNCVCTLPTVLRRRMKCVRGAQKQMDTSKSSTLISRSSLDMTLREDMTTYSKNYIKMCSFTQNRGVLGPQVELMRFFPA
jgi:hypothetical protein